MNLKTQRLSLRPLHVADLNFIHELYSLPETDQYNTSGIPENIYVTENLLNNWLTDQQITPQASYIFCIEKADTNQLIGLIGLKIGKPHYHIAEIWYKTHKNFWGYNYTTEALKSILAFAFTTLRLHRIEAGCAVENQASIRVLEKVGMTCEGRKRKILPIRDEWVDNYFFAILEEDFK